MLPWSLECLPFFFKVRPTLCVYVRVQPPAKRGSVQRSIIALVQAAKDEIVMQMGRAKE